MSYFIKKRSEEVQVTADKVAELTGCGVIHCSKSSGSMRFYFSVILQKKDGEWEKDFCDYDHDPDFPSRWDGKAFRWLRGLGLNPAFCPEFYRNRYDQVFVYLHWKDIEKLGVKPPEVRTAREISKGLTLEQLDRR